MANTSKPANPVTPSIRRQRQMFTVIGSLDREAWELRQEINSRRRKLREVRSTMDSYQRQLEKVCA